MDRKRTVPSCHAAPRVSAPSTHPIRQQAGPRWPEGLVPMCGPPIDQLVAVDLFHLFSRHKQARIHMGLCGISAPFQCHFTSIHPLRCRCARPHPYGMIRRSDSNSPKSSAPKCAPVEPPKQQLVDHNPDPPRPPTAITHSPLSRSNQTKQIWGNGRALHG